MWLRIRGCYRKHERRPMQKKPSVPLCCRMYVYLSTMNIGDSSQFVMMMSLRRWSRRQVVLNDLPTGHLQAPT